MEVILFKDSNDLSDMVENRLSKCKSLELSVVVSGANFDLGNMRLPAILYSGRYYSGDSGLNDFKKDIVNDLQYSAMKIKNSFYYPETL